MGRRSGELQPAVGGAPMPFSQATAGTLWTDAARKSQHARQLDVNLFSDVRKIHLRDRNPTSEKILTCYRPDPAPKGRAAARPGTPQAKRHWAVPRGYACARLTVLMRPKLPVRPSGPGMIEHAEAS